jgi:hypothetical protein
VGGSKLAIGAAAEAELSKKVHIKGVPILISSSLLREFGCGQIDVSMLYKNSSGENCVAIFEVKSSEAVSAKQIGRLKMSAEFISTILDCPASCFLATGRNILCQIH